jgi:hypothetical protein
MRLWSVVQCVFADLASQHSRLRRNSLWPPLRVSSNGWRHQNLWTLQTLQRNFRPLEQTCRSFLTIICFINEKNIVHLSQLTWYAHGVRRAIKYIIIKIQQSPISKYLSNAYPIQDGTKHGGALSIFILNSLHITKAQENQNDTEVRVAHEVSVHAAGSFRVHNRLSSNSTHPGQFNQFH